MLRTFFRPSVHATRRFGQRYFTEVSEFMETDATYRELYATEDLNLRQTKVEYLDQGDWLLHATGQPAVIRKFTKRNAGSGRGAARYEFDFKLALPWVQAWDRFSGVTGSKEITTFPRPPDHPHLLIGHTETEDFIFCTVLNDVNEHMPVRIQKKRTRVAEEFARVLEEKKEHEVVLIMIQEAPIKRQDGTFHIGQIVQKVQPSENKADSEFQYLYHEEEDDQAIVSCINDEGDPVDFKINKIIDKGVLWAKINADIETYEETGNLMYIECSNLEGRFGPIRVVTGTRFDEL